MVFIITFFALCVFTFLIIVFIFYKAMMVNRADIALREKSADSNRPLASRTPPRIEQKIAIQAGVYHVLPVLEDDITYSVTAVRTTKPNGETQFASAVNASGVELWKTPFYSREYVPQLETDVQTVYVVDLYLDQDHLFIKLENRPVITLDKRSGALVTKHRS